MASDIRAPLDFIIPSHETMWCIGAVKVARAGHDRGAWHLFLLISIHQMSARISISWRAERGIFLKRGLVSPEIHRADDSREQHPHSSLAF